MFERHIADLAQAAVAGVGGIIAALLRKETTGILHTILVGAGAMFLGFIVAKLCRVSGLNEDMSIIFTALSGWVGANRTSNILETLLKNRLGLKAEDKENKQ